VGRGDAARAMDRGWEVAEAAVDSEPRQRLGSVEVWSSGKRKAVELHVCERKSESVGSSRTYFKSRKRHGGRELLLASRRHAWRLRRWRHDVEQRGEGQRGEGVAARVLGRHVAQRKAAWGSWCSSHGRRGRRDRAERKTERGRLEADEEGPGCNLSKVQGLHCKARLTFKSVGFIKIYNFALRFTCKRAKDLNLT
jgi:hypothetical protein